jgi:hypothetical protein
MDAQHHDPAVDDSYEPLGIKQLVQFIRLAALVKNDILLCQPSKIPDMSVPLVLLPSVSEFLAELVAIVPKEDVAKHWAVLKDKVWSMTGVEVCEEDEKAVHAHGWKHGLSKSSH